MKIIPPFALIYALTASLLCAEETYDAVAHGENVYSSVGCIECHTVEKGDQSFKTGPNLYGLFLSEPRDREVSIPKDGTREKIKADREYFNRSIRKSWDQLAISETGPTKGDPYQPVMPIYPKEVISDDDLDALWHYLRTLADKDQRGPEKVLLKRASVEKSENPLEIPGEEIVTDRTRVLRANIRGTSARAIHVGQPNGMSYSFDPRMLSLRRIWTGGFLNLKEERSGRGKNPSSLGVQAKTYLDDTPVLAPLTAAGNIVDFEFKEPDTQDHTAIEKHVWDDRDFADKLASLDADYLGHNLNPDTGNPTFHIRIGKNTLTQSITIDDAGQLTITLNGELKTNQSFAVGHLGKKLTQTKVSAGTLNEQTWKLPAKTKGPFVFTAKLPGGVIARPQVDTKENWEPQKLVTRPAKPARKPLELPAGYSLEDWLPPSDLYGRDQLFEPTGIDVAKDGTIVVATRTAGVWRLRDGYWSLFTESTFEALGVHIEDDHGNTIVVAHKPELTRIRDTNGDGRADDFATMTDDYGLHGNYHEYTHGPVRDEEGNYYFLLNLSHGGTEKVSWRGGGKFMGSMGGYRGWACRVTPEGKFEPYAMGLRSPAGLGIDPAGRLWYAENQGEYVGSSKIVPLEKGKFYGHLSGLITLPGMKPDSPQLDFKHWENKLRKGAVWLPHGMMANSPGNMVWDLTQGKFGPFQNQMFVGDQTLSTVMRVITEQVNNTDQGCVVPFARWVASGVMRPRFLPDGSLLIGQTGRGWGSRGGEQQSLQRIIYDGKTIPADIEKVSASPKGFTIHFTQPLDNQITPEQFTKTLAVNSWFYTNNFNYGSPKHDEREEAIEQITFHNDRTTARIDLKNFGRGDGWIDRLYHLKIQGTNELFGEAPARDHLEAFYTVRSIPKP